MSKDALLNRLQDQIDQWSAEIEALAAKADKADPQARREYQKQIDELKEELGLAMKKREELQRGGRLRHSGHSWESPDG